MHQKKFAWHCYLLKNQKDAETNLNKQKKPPRFQEGFYFKCDLIKRFVQLRSRKAIQRLHRGEGERLRCIYLCVLRYQK